MAVAVASCISQPAQASACSSDACTVLTQPCAPLFALQVSKAHNDLIRVYEAKLVEHNIPPEQLGFRPLITSTSTGPAGLVAGQ